MNLIDSLLEALLGSEVPALNADLNQRIVVSAGNRDWQRTLVPGLSICLLENHVAVHRRMTALLKLDVASSTNTTGGVDIPANGLEILVEHGLIADDESEYVHPFYIRQPPDSLGTNQQFTLYPGSHRSDLTKHQLEFYVATGQLAPTDTQRRCINLSDHNLWLPGPVSHTEVMPLHMHNGNNSMLVRWNESLSFKPKLDPNGEEVLVIHGTLTDDNGSYPAGSWIRNPVAAWQDWGAEAGTLIYYKNGHFGTANN